MTSLVYSTGTVSVSNASAVVTGTGTAWALALVTGGMFSFAGMSVPILSVESDTSLTLAYPWPGTTASGAYAIARETSEAVRAAWINDRLAQILTKLALVGIHPDGAGTLAERNALSPVPPTGFLWLRVEIGFDLGFYKKTASGWDGPFAVKGDVGGQGPAGPQGFPGADGDVTWEGPWVTATVYTANQAVSRNGASYVCTANHTAGAANEPGVGASWATVWDLMAAKGAAGAAGASGAPGVVQSIVAGTNISVNNSDPANPVVSSSAAGVTDGDKGDITVSGSGAAWTVDNNAVTYAKMQDVSATARVLGRKTAGAGDPEELTLSDVLNMVGSAAEGDILYRSAAGWTRLPKGTAGQYLKQNTALTAPVWVTVTEREVLTANRTYYVRTDGNDANDGLANTAGGAFLTIAKALAVAAGLDGSIYNVTVQVGAGTWTVPVVLPQFIGSGTWSLIGDPTTPANVLINVTGSCITANAINSAWTVNGFKLQSTSHGLFVTAASILRYTNIDFGACSTSHVCTDAGGMAIASGPTAISGGALIHWFLSGGSMVLDQGKTITITGTPNFGNSFLQAGNNCTALVNQNTFVGSATGKRYTVDMNSVCNVNGGGASYLPGSIAGTTATGGQYA